MLTTDQKGAIAEAAIVAAAIEAGIGVARPFVDERYDLIFDLGSSLLRIQCKWASRVGEVIVVRCYSARRSATGLIKRVYRHEDVDAFAIYCHETRGRYLIPFRGGLSRRDGSASLGACAEQPAAGNPVGQGV
jgi:hypothetical protein